MTRNQNELRIFISSTFRDLQEEREYLIKKVFPEIRALCRERGITFTEVDLRWGLTEEHQVLGHVIRTCLEEIDRCRPFFIGITGDRYGYVPEFHEIHKDGELLKQYPWIEDAALDASSIIDMEFRHGALNRRSDDGAYHASNAHFYFRRHRPGFDDDVIAGSEQEQLEYLKKRVRDARFPIDEFRDPVSLGAMIHHELMEIINRDFAHSRPLSPLDQERSKHAAFAASRRHAYIPNVTYLKRLNDFIRAEGGGMREESEGKRILPLSDSSLIPHPSSLKDPSQSSALIIYAESGSGKSSLVSFWAEQYRRRNPDAHVVEHYIGIGAGATDHYATMRHVMAEIKERFNRDEELPSTPEEIERQFANWLGFARGKVRDEGKERDEGGGMRDGSAGEGTVPLSDSSLIPPPSSLILILDGLNQLSGVALNLNWLPRFIPSNIKLIVTSTVDQTLVQLRERGWEQLGMQPLIEGERGAIIVRFLSDYHKALSPEQVKRIASDQKCAHPLFLRTLLEELRLFGQHERLEWEISKYLNTTGTEDLFQVVLERMEEDFGLRAVREVMCLIWAARTGLSEIELLELTGLSRLKLSSLIMALDFHMVKREGLYTFFHDYLRRAVDTRYLITEEKGRQEHLQLADYFEKQVEACIAADRKKEAVSNTD